MPSFIKSVSYALNGLRLAFTEKHFIVHIVISVLVIMAGLFFGITQTEWLICLLLFGLVISLEIINTAIEYLVDLVSPQQHPQAGAVKDLASGAVLFSCIISIICGICIFGKYVLALIMPTTFIK